MTPVTLDGHNLKAKYFPVDFCESCDKVKLLRHLNGLEGELNEQRWIIFYLSFPSHDFEDGWRKSGSLLLNINFEGR